METIKDTKHQLMVITMEECAELSQACSKLLRFGEQQDTNRLVEEVGDVMCMIELLHEYNFISWQDVEDRAKIKREKLKKWSNLIK